MKVLSLALAFLVVSAIFATFAFADAEDSDAEDSDNVISDLDVQDTSILEDIVEDSNETIPGYRHFGAAQVTKGQGWALSGETGYLINIIWASQSYANAQLGDLEMIRERYKECEDSEGKRSRNCTQQAAQQLRESANETIQKRSFGVLHLGVGRESERFKLVKEEFTNESVSFLVYTIDSRNASRDQVGSLTLAPEHYSGFTLWSGDLEITSGDHQGNYEVSVASKSVVASGLGPMMGQGNGQGQKKGFLQRMMFWRR